MANKNTVPNVKVKLQGKEIGMMDIRLVEIEEAINRCSSFRIKLELGDMQKGNWKHLDMQEYVPGKEVKIYMGMDSPVEMFAGEIHSIRCSLEKRYGILEVSGFDRLYRLSLESKSRTFKDKRDSDLAAMIAQDSGLQAKTTPTSISYPYLMQNNQTDLQFLLERARRIRYEVGVRDKTLFFRESQENLTPSSILKYALDIEEFSAELQALSEGGKVTVQAWDYKKKTAIRTEVSTGKEVSKMAATQTGEAITKKAFGTTSSTTITEEGVLDINEARQIATAQFNRNLTETVMGEGMSRGNTNLRAGKTIQITGIGKFSGIYYVTSTKHRIDQNGYYTSFEVRRTGI